MNPKDRSGIKGFEGRPTALADAIEYQEASVVSREVIKGDCGTVTLFAFDQGQGLSEHTAPYDAMVYILEGEAEITLAGRTLHPRTGEMLIMPANEPHALKALQKFKMILVMIRN